MTEEQILCSASKYTEKFYLNPRYSNLPQKIKDELKIACVIFTEEIHIMLLPFWLTVRREIQRLFLNQ